MFSTNTGKSQRLRFKFSLDILEGLSLIYQGRVFRALPIKYNKRRRHHSKSEIWYSPSAQAKDIRQSEVGDLGEMVQTWHARSTCKCVGGGSKVEVTQFSLVAVSKVETGSGYLFRLEANHRKLVES